MKQLSFIGAFAIMLCTFNTLASTLSRLSESFNPSISVVIEGGFAATRTHADNYAIAGFDIGHPEGRVEGDGFYVGHNELTFSSNVDDLFFGQATIVIAEHDDDIEVELEEAFLQTVGLPYGLSLKAGRMLPIVGYLNEKHLHSDVFIERPLAYQAFLGGHFFDDGIQASLILPTDLYTEVGGGVFRGRAYPATHDDGIGSATAYVRVGGDINTSTSWRLGVSGLFATPDDREVGHRHGHAHDHEDEDEDDEHGELAFSGDSYTFVTEGKLEWAPDGNSRDRKLELRGEYFIRHEDGHYHDDEDTPHFEGTSHGFYVMASYKFHPNWSAGLRYDHLFPVGDLDADLEGTALDAEGHDPKAGTLLLQFAPSEFSRIRTSYTVAELDAHGETDHRFFLNLMFSLGSHSAHRY